MTARRVAGVVGRVLVAFGVLLLLFVAYQLWGTGIQEARAQDSLRRSFTEVVQADVPDAPDAPPPDPVPGDAIALLRIPRIGLDKTVVEGVTVPDLKKAPGHYPGTPLPGQPGNAAIAGHRTTYGQPFYRLNELEPGDEILVTTRQGEFTYEVEGTQIVKPSQTEVLNPTDDDRLTLTTCHPRYSARQRLIVTATLQGKPAIAPPRAPREEAQPIAFEEPSLSGDRSAATPTVLWGLLAALVALLTWLATKRVPRVPAYLLGGVAFLVVLFVFFENVARLLPANI